MIFNSQSKTVSKQPMLLFTAKESPFVRKWRKRTLATVFNLKGEFSRIGTTPRRTFDNVEIAPFLHNAAASCTISTDLALGWAYRAFSESTRMQIAKRERDNVPILLKLFEEHSIPLTWSVVGHLMLDSCQRSARGLAHAYMPRPLGSSRARDWYANDPCTSLLLHPLWYGRDLLAAIGASPLRHEIASHSFSCIDFSCNHASSELVLAELSACIRASEEAFVSRPRTITFPGNRMGNTFWRIIARCGITAARWRDSSVRLSYPPRTPTGVYKHHESMSLMPSRHYDARLKAEIFLERAMDRHAAFHLRFNLADPHNLFATQLPALLNHVADLSSRGQVWPTTIESLTAYCEARRTTSIAIAAIDEVVKRYSITSSFDRSHFGDTSLTFLVPCDRSPRTANIVAGNQSTAVSSQNLIWLKDIHKAAITVPISGSSFHLELLL